MPDQLTVPQERRAARRFGVRAILAFIAVALAAVPFSIIVVLVTAQSDPLLHADHETADSLHTFAIGHPDFTAAMKVIGVLASSAGWFIVLIPLVAWLLYRRLPRLAAFVAVTAIGSSLLNTLIKTAVDRARPHLTDPVATAGGTSFPSGHAQAATVGCGILVLIFMPIVARRYRAWLYVAAALIIAVVGFSRMALGVHYLSDVVGAVVIGGAWLLAMTAVFSAWRRAEHKPPVHSGEGLEPEQRERLTPGDTGGAPPE
jgi:membrane-associated phospholipid phosphatase